MKNTEIVKSLNPASLLGIPQEKLRVLQSLNYYVASVRPKNDYETKKPIGTTLELVVPREDEDYRNQRLTVWTDKMIDSDDRLFGENADVRIKIVESKGYVRDGRPQVTVKVELTPLAEYKAQQNQQRQQNQKQNNHVTDDVSSSESLLFIDIIHLLEEESNQGSNLEIISIASTPIVKALINYGGKKRGRRNGGTKGLLEDMVLEYFKNHPDEFKGFEYQE